MTHDSLQARIQAIFRTEAAELLTDLEAALLELEGSPNDTGTIARVFRALHTIKGSGATSGFPELSAFVHRVEDVFFAAREGRLSLSAEHIDHALGIADVIQRYLAAAPEDAAAILESGRGTLRALLDSVPSGDAPPPDAAASAPAPAPRRRRYAIRYLPKPSLFATGNDPGVQLDDLRSLGACTVRGLEDRIPSLDTLDPQSCHLGWEIELETEAPLEAIRDVFMFVEEDCELSIRELPAADPVPASTRAWRVDFDVDAQTASSPALVDSLLLELGKLGRHRIERSPDLLDGRRGPGTWRIVLETAPSTSLDAIRDAFLFIPGVDPSIVGFEDGVSPPPSENRHPAAPVGIPAEKSAQPPAPPPKSGPTAPESLRVSADKLDRLVNMVGELVILRSQVSRVCATIKDAPAELQGASEALDRLTKELRDVVLEVRMMPIGETFSKFRRLSRDLARELGKSVELRIEGSETELDKTVLEQLRDPLVHLVRNCLDHGLETPAERLAAGKPEQGTLRLAAEQRGDRVWVTVADDGRGLDASRIRAKAVARGLLAPDAAPSESEIFQLIFLPGFSTAETVSQVSGRGVGLDVVKRQIEALRGSVTLRSSPGRGTEIQMAVPLTVAIIEGLLVRVENDHYVFPLGLAQETIELTRRQREASGGRNVVPLRGNLVPYLRLRDLFDYTSGAPELERAVIVSCGDQRLALVVDEVLGSHQTVLKPLGWLSRHVRAFSGATVLGDGRIGLICDVPALIAYAAEKNGPGTALER